MRLMARNLSLAYESPSGSVLPALGPVNFEIESGSFVCLVGPSGCGKSSLIRILAGLQPASQGEAFIGQQVIHEPSAHIGLMFQEANLMPWRTVRDNMALPLELAGVSQSERYAAVNDQLQGLGLADFSLAYPGELSGGMAQRVAIGRVLIQQPEVLLLDEPFGALDALTREQVSLDLLHVWARQKQTVLMVTHDINEAVMLSDRVLVMSNRPGQIIADITVDMPRPRRLDLIYSDTFGAIAQQIRNKLGI